MSERVIIPFRSLSEDALRGVVEDFVTREGTDYGLYEHTLAQKYDAVIRQLERGEALIVFDPEAEAVSVVLRDEALRG